MNESLQRNMLGAESWWKLDTPRGYAVAKGKNEQMADPAPLAGSPGSDARDQPRVRNGKRGGAWRVRQLGGSRQSVAAMSPQPMGPFRSVGLGLLGLGILVGAWYFLIGVGITLRGRLPSPQAIVLAAWHVLATPSGRGDVLVSTQRVFEGLLLGIFLAIPVAFFLSIAPKVRAAAYPLINFARALPPIALVPLVILYLGIGEPARLFVLTWATFFVGVIIIYDGIGAIDPIYLRGSAVLGATRRETFFRVILPLSLPAIFTALRVGLAVSWGTLVAAELVAARTGLGVLISISAEYFNMSTIYVAIIFIGILAVIMDRIIVGVARRVLRWQEILQVSR